MSLLQEQAELAEEIAKFSLDPLGFVLFAFPWGMPGTELEHETGPRPWQREQLREIGERLRAGYSPGAILEPLREATVSGHGIGKSAEVSWLIWWALSTCEDAKVVLTANTEQQLRTKTWPEINKWGRLLICRHWFRITGTSIVARQEGHEKLWRCDAVTWSEDNLEAFAGLHNLGKRIVLIFDEASGIADKVWEVSEGALTDANTEILWCVFGNPTEPSGTFYRCFNRMRHRWRTRQIDSRKVPGTNLALFQQWVDDYGEDSDFVRVRVRGVFPRAGTQQFIGTDLAEAATKRESDAIPSDAFVMGVDIARFGDDQTVLAFRKGRDARMVAWIKLRNLNLMQVAARIADEVKRWSVDAVFVDGSGIGAGVVDRLRQMNVPGVVEIDFGSNADRSDFAAAPVRYANKRAEMWGYMREWLARGCIPNDPEIITDLTGVQYGFSADNAIQLESKKDMKKRGLASPDCGDALALTFAYPVFPSAMAGGPNALSRVPARARRYDPHGAV